MFPSSGYFSHISCPFLAEGCCDRPYCNFKHLRIESKENSIIQELIKLNILFDLKRKKMVEKVKASCSESEESFSDSSLSEQVDNNGESGTVPERVDDVKKITEILNNNESFFEMLLQSKIKSPETSSQVNDDILEQGKFAELNQNINEPDISKLEMGLEPDKTNGKKEINIPDSPSVTITKKNETVTKKASKEIKKNVETKIEGEHSNKKEKKTEKKSKESRKPPCSSHFDEIDYRMSLLMSTSKKVEESVPSISSKLASKIMAITKILLENPSLIEKEYRYLKSKAKDYVNSSSNSKSTKSSKNSCRDKAKTVSSPTATATPCDLKRKGSTEDSDLTQERTKKIRLSLDEISLPPRFSLSPDNSTSINDHLLPTQPPQPTRAVICAPRKVIVPPRNVAALVNRPIFTTDTKHSPRHRLQQLIQTGQIPSITNGTVSVPKGHRQMYLKHMVDVFKSSTLCITLDEAIEKAAELEEKAFTTHHDNFKKYKTAIFTAKMGVVCGSNKKNNKSPSETELYDLVLPLILSPEKLKENGYLTLNEKHQVEIYHSEKYNFNSKWKHIIAACKKGLRYCTRCSKEYQVDENGVQTIPNCSFHTQRKKKMLSRVRTGESFYPCCAGEDPCTTEPFHITENNDEIIGSFSAPHHPDGIKRVVALDCEMVATFNGIELAHIVVIDMRGEVIYESLVKPAHPIASYLTEFSGLTPQIMASASKTLPQVQKELCQIINSDTIIIGHSLDSDFKAMKLIHRNVVDTSILFMKEAFTIDDYHYKTSLKVLAREHLSRVIQENECGHDPLEDAKAAFDVVKKHVGIQI